MPELGGIGTCLDSHQRRTRPLSAQQRDPSGQAVRSLARMSNDCTELFIETVHYETPHHRKSLWAIIMIITALKISES